MRQTGNWEVSAVGTKNIHQQGLRYADTKKTKGTIIVFILTY